MSGLGGRTESGRASRLWRLAFLCAVILTLLMIAVACGGPKKSADRQLAELYYPIVSTERLAAMGKPIYGTRCASCHGDAQTPPPLAAAPPHTDQGHTWHHQDRLLVEWILDGVPLATLMPKWRGTLTEEEVRAVVAYLKTFWSDEIRTRQAEGSAEYEKQIAEIGR